MALHLVRHALAGVRRTWRGVDFERPLDEIGAAQAEAIGTYLSAKPVKRVMSSPALRCTETVEPLARLLGLTVELSEELAEGTYVAESMDLILRLARGEHSASASDFASADHTGTGDDAGSGGFGDSVLCSHGDVIPSIIWALAGSGMQIPDMFRCKKASIWELTVREGRVVAATYHHPREFNANLA